MENGRAMIAFIYGHLRWEERLETVLIISEPQLSSVSSISRKLKDALGFFL